MPCRPMPGMFVLNLFALVRPHSSPEFAYVMDHLTAAGGFVFVAYLVLVWRRAKERRRRRWNRDRCGDCGYDVRMSAEKCPECGKPIRRFPRHTSEITVTDDRR